MNRVQGLYIISVAAQILEMHPQTLRKYERAGFIEPPRMGTLRLYSDEDIARLRLIKHFVEELGLNLAGVELALDLSHQLLQLRSTLSDEAKSHEDKQGETIHMIDRILANLGIEVAEEKHDARQGPGTRSQAPRTEGPVRVTPVTAPRHA